MRLEVSAVAAALVGYLVSLGLFALMNWNFWSWSNDIFGVLCEKGHVMRQFNDVGYSQYKYICIHSYTIK